jgi:hypothetical protein
LHFLVEFAFNYCIDIYDLSFPFVGIFPKSRMNIPGKLSQNPEGMTYLWNRSQNYLSRPNVGLPKIQNPEGMTYL